MKHPVCPVTATLNLIGKKWHMMVIYNLMEGPKRFNELKAKMGGVSSKTLAASLRSLEKNGILRREVRAASPIQVTYSLTGSGKALESVFSSLHDWGSRWLDESPKKPVGFK